MINKTFKRDYILIAVGFFAWFAFLSLAFTIEYILKHLFFILNMRNEFIFGICEITYNILIISSFYLLFKSHKSDSNYIKTIRNLILIYVITQIIQFLISIYGINYILENYYNNWSSYSEFNRKFPRGLIINSLMEYVRFLFISLIIYFFIKRESN